MKAEARADEIPEVRSVAAGLANTGAETTSSGAQYEVVDGTDGTVIVPDRFPVEEVQNDATLSDEELKILQRRTKVRLALARSQEAREKTLAAMRSQGDGYIGRGTLPAVQIPPAAFTRGPVLMQIDGRKKPHSEFYSYSKIVRCSVASYFGLMTKQTDTC